MAMDRNFRSALGGFNRSDVVNFIEEASINFEKNMRQLKDENEKLRTQVEQLQQEKDRLAATLAEQAEAGQSETNAPAAEAEAEPAEQAPRQPVQSAEAAGSDLSKTDEKELAAYRRAEAMERGAKKRAAALCRHVNEIVESASARFDESGSEIDALMQDLSISLRRLTDTFAEFKLVFDDTTDAFHKTELLDSDHEAS